MHGSLRQTAVSERIYRFIQRVDDRVKLYVTLLSGAVAFVCIDIRSLMLLSVSTLVLGLLCRLRKSIAVTLAVWVIVGPLMWGINRLPFLGPFVPGFGLFILVVKFTPIFVMMMVVYSTLNVSRFLHTLEKSGLPKGFVIPLGICIRFIPSLTEELWHIRNAMRLRGIGVSFGNVMRKPFKTIEYILIPLLMRSLRISDELAKAALTRGIDNPGPKSSLQVIRFGHGDAAAAVAWSAFMVLVIYFDRLFCRLYP
jgi:energy-coupling factor transporter transmembrane protein EcfT